MILDDRFVPARIDSIRDLSPTVREFTLAPQGGVAAWTPGSHLRVQVRIGDTTDVRSYSLVGLPGTEHYRIAVKRTRDSRGGSRFMWSLNEGGSLPINTPANSFELPRASALAAPAILVVAGGIGITPLVGLALELARLRPDRGVEFRYAAADAGELVYAGELHAALGARLRTFDGAAGQRLDLDAEIAALPQGAQLLVCGPMRLLQAAQAAWQQSGRRAVDLRFETFGSGGTREAQPFRVELPRHGLTIEVPADRSLLDMLEAHGVQALSDCRKGECGLCVLDVVSTDAPLDHRDVFFSPGQKERGDKLCACVSRACGGTVVLDTAWRADT